MAAAPAEQPLIQLEGDVFVCDLGCGFVRALVHAAAAGRSTFGASAAGGLVVFAAAGLAASATEQYQVVDDDLGLVLLLAGLFVVPGVGAERALDVDGAPFLEVFAGDLGGALEGDQVVPLGAVLPLAFFVFEALVGGEGELCDRHAAGREFHFRVLAEIADQDDFV